MNRGAAGLSLLEILIAVALLAMIMAPVLFTFGAGTRGIQMTQEEFLAHNAALELLEQLSATPFDLLPVGSFTDAQVRDSLAMGPKSLLKFHISSVPNLQRSLEIKEIRQGTMVRFKKIEVGVAILDRNGKPTGRIVNLKSLLANEKI